MTILVKSGVELTQVESDLSIMRDRARGKFHEAEDDLMKAQKAFDLARERLQTIEDVITHLEPNVRGNLIRQ